ncbi:MAG: type II toxin-antitoxin system VapC family toxin [Thiohalomonadaceae bacterium]
MMVVLDASALLAFLHDEPGGGQVESELDGAVMSTVNWSEVVQKALQRGVDVCGIREDLQELGMQIIPFSAKQAELAADLYEMARTHGLSLADRACLALALDSQASILTADRVWQHLKLPLSIELIR